jgi:hypothetical protein
MQTAAFFFFVKIGGYCTPSNVSTGEVIEMPYPRARAPPSPFVFEPISKKRTEER